MPPLRRRRLASLTCFLLGCILLSGAGALLLLAWTAPYEGLQDLGRIVGAMVIGAASFVPFLLAIVFANEETPRWTVAASIVGAVIGLIPALALLAVRL